VKPSVNHIAKSDAGRIVIMNSVTAKWPERGMAVVSAARAAVANLSQSLALDLADTGICVNVINIGVIDTDRQRARGTRCDIID
ncbi:MAG: SDR family NAD(P)-dependent oxidoreductase, partial [Geminicoccaceae bacterium]